MDGQSLPFTSFTKHNFYSIPSEIIFVTDEREVTLHTSFGIGGGFVPRSVTKQFANTWTPPPPPQSALGPFFFGLAETFRLERFRFLQFLEQIAEYLRELCELSNSFDAFSHFTVNLIRFLLGRPGELL